jgi:hypothetical protein
LYRTCMNIIWPQKSTGRLHVQHNSHQVETHLAEYTFQRAVDTLLSSGQHSGSYLLIGCCRRACLHLSWPPARCLACTCW